MHTQPAARCRHCQRVEGCRNKRSHCSWASAMQLRSALLAPEPPGPREDCGLWCGRTIVSARVQLGGQRAARCRARRDRGVFWTRPRGSLRSREPAARGVSWPQRGTPPAGKQGRKRAGEPPAGVADNYFGSLWPTLAPPIIYMSYKMSRAMAVYGLAPRPAREIC